MRQPKGIDRTIALGMLGAGALVAIAAPAASAASTDSQWSHLGQIKLYPLAGTAVDPLSNTMGTDLGGLPISTAPVSAVFANGLPMRELPLVGDMLAAPAGNGMGTNTGTNPNMGTNAAADNQQPATNAGAAGPVGVTTPAGPVIGLQPAVPPHVLHPGPLQ